MQTVTDRNESFNCRIQYVYVWSATRIDLLLMAVMYQKVSDQTGGLLINWKKVYVAKVK